MERVTLIFGRSSRAIGLLIRIFDISPWSHVGIVSGDWVYESTGVRYKGRIARRKGVIKTPLSVFKSRCSAWRMKEMVTHNQSWLEQCEDMVGKKVEYDMLETIGSLWIIRLFRIKIGCKHSLNCSEFVDAVLHRFREDYSPTVGDWWRLKV
jgi:hypothetical protein